MYRGFYFLDLKIGKASPATENLFQWANGRRRQRSNSQKCSEGTAWGRWHRVGHAHRSFPLVGLKPTKATTLLKPEPEEEWSGWGHTCLHWWPSVLCICNTISAKLSSFTSRACGNYDLIGLHNVLSNYWLYLFVYFSMHVYPCIFSNSWHWSTQTKSEEERRMLGEETSPQKGSTPTHRRSSDGASSEPAPRHAAIRAGVTNPPRLPRPPNSRLPTVCSLRALKHPSREAETLLESSRFCELPHPQRRWHCLSATAQTKWGSRTRVLFLAGWGSRVCPRRDRASLRVRTKYEAGAGSWRGWNSEEKSKLLEEEPTPVSSGFPFSHFAHPPWVRCWKALVHRDDDYSIDEHSLHGVFNTHRNQWQHFSTSAHVRLCWQQ